MPQKFTEAVARCCSVKNVFLKSFAKFTGKHLCHSIFFNKVAGPRPANLLKKRLWHKYLPLSFGKFLRLLLTLQFLYPYGLFYFKIKTRSVHPYQNEKHNYYFLRKNITNWLDWILHFKRRTYLSDFLWFGYCFGISEGNTWFFTLKSSLALKVLRSSGPEVFCKKMWRFSKIQKKTLVLEPVFN